MRHDEHGIATASVWLLFGALCVHNLEEALTYARFREQSAHLISRVLGHHVTLPSLPAFILALAAVTAVAAAISIWVGRSPFNRAKRAAVYGFVTILLANVLLPHLPAAYWLGGYAPGVVTAVFVNIPVAVVVLVRLRGRR